MVVGAEKGDRYGDPCGDPYGDPLHHMIRQRSKTAAPEIDGAERVQQQAPADRQQDDVGKRMQEHADADEQTLPMAGQPVERFLKALWSPVEQRQPPQRGAVVKGAQVGERAPIVWRVAHRPGSSTVCMAIADSGCPRGSSVANGVCDWTSSTRRRLSIRW